LNSKSKESLNLLHALRNLSFDRVSHNKLSILIPTLCSIGLQFQKKNEFPKEIFNQSTHCLFNLCRKNRIRQELAVNSGLVAFLLFVVKNNKPLKEFAVPLICELATTSVASTITKASLFENRVVEFYLELLRDKSSFVTDALEAIAACLAIPEERNKVETIIFNAKPPLSDYFVNPINQVQESVLETLMEGLIKALFVSSKLSISLGNDKSENSLVSALKKKLTTVTQANARVSLLKTLLRIKQNQPNDFLRSRDLESLVTNFAQKDPSMLVQNIAKSILSETYNSN